MTEQEMIDKIKKETESKDNAYWERMQLVAFLSHLYEAHLCRHPDEDKTWEDDWRWIVCIHTPAGQMTWHMHDSHLEYFGHLAKKSEAMGNDNHWDGHTTEEKYDRLKALGHMNTSQKPLTQLDHA